MHILHIKNVESLEIFVCFPTCLILVLNLTIHIVLMTESNKNVYTNVS